MLNKCFFSGNLTRDIELKYTPSGVAVVNFSIAINESYKDKNGETKQTVCFIDCEAWDSGAEAIAEEFGKGEPIMIVGKLRQESWEDTDGKKRNKIKIRVESFAKPIYRKKNSEPKQKTSNENYQSDADNDEDVPF